MAVPRTLVLSFDILRVLTHVLIDVFINDAKHGLESAERLRRCLRTGALTACDVVWAEVSGMFGDVAEFASAMNTLGVRFSALNEESARRAGMAWRAYRKSGGARERVIADFLIGAHASGQADRLLARDRGFYRQYYHDVKLAEADRA